MKVTRVDVGYVPGYFSSYNRFSIIIIMGTKIRFQLEKRQMSANNVLPYVQDETGGSRLDSSQQNVERTSIALPGSNQTFFFNKK